MSPPTGMIRATPPSAQRLFTPTDSEASDKAPYLYRDSPRSSTGSPGHPHCLSPAGKLMLAALGSVYPEVQIEADFMSPHAKRSRHI